MRRTNRVMSVRIMGLALLVFLVNSSNLLADARPGGNRIIPVATGSKLALVDDTIIVTLAPGADMDKVKDVLNEVHGTVLRKLHIDRDNYDILFIKPERGQEEKTIEKISGKKDKNFRSIDRNYNLSPMQSVPNDPGFPNQWACGDLDFTQSLVFTPKQAPRMTLADTGVNPTMTNNELVPSAQFDCTGQTGQTAVQETPIDVEGHGTSTASVSVSTTNNSTNMCGIAVLQPSLAAQWFECRITTTASPGSASGTAVINAFTWAVNNQSLRGGPSPIS